MEDEESGRLFNLVKRGDLSAVDQLFRRYADRLLRIVRHKLGREMRGKVESMDVLQEAMLRALPGLQNFEPRSEGALLHWFSTHIERQILHMCEHFRAAKRDSRQEVPLDPAPGDGDSGALFEHPSEDPTPSKAALVSDEMRRTEEVLDRLESEQKELILMRAYAGMTFEEIAQIQGRTADTVRKAYSRALAEVGTAIDA